MFSSLAQDLATSTASKELKVDKVEFDTHHRDKVRASDVGELTRSLNKVNLMIFLLFSFYNDWI